MGSSRLFWVACLVTAALLFSIELTFLPLPGLQQDEALFLRPFLRGESALYSVALGNIRVPVMLMDYVGCLKTWLYWPVFRLWRPGIWSIRLPICFVSIGTLLLFAGLVRRVAGARIAMCSALLLAVDASFVFTNVFDWGPVALVMAGVLSFLALLLRFTASAKKSVLAAAFLVAGIMLWYKAVFLFPLAGILFASAGVFPRELRRRATAGNLAVMGLSLLLGASPLLLFNLQSGGATLKAPATLPRMPMDEKVLMLRLTLNGKGLEHLMFRSFPGEVLPLQGPPLGDLVKIWYRESALGPGSLLLAAVLMSALALPLVRTSRLFTPIVFAWVAGLSTAALFSVTGNGGGGPHHTVLLYPAPQFIVTSTAAAVAERMRGPIRRLLLPGVVAVVAASSVVLLVNYHREAVRNGFSVYWTDATRPLAEALRGERQPVAFLDWGLETPTRVESADTLPVVVPAAAREGVLYVTHAAGYEIGGAGTNGILRDAAAHGLAPSATRTFADSQGNAVLSVFSLSARQK